MDKFIKLGNHIIVNVAEIRKFRHFGNTIRVYYKNPDISVDDVVMKTNEEAEALFADIPHLIDHSHIPDWVRANNMPIQVYKPERTAVEYVENCFDELPF